MIRWLAWKLGLVKHRYPSLNMGRITHYSLVIPKSQLKEYRAKGWQETRNFWIYRKKIEANQTVVMSRPTTLTEINESVLIGQTITEFSPSFGSYGNGGPGFFGIALSDQPIEQKFLVYAVWGADQYVLLDDREIMCSPRYYDVRHPWLSFFSDEDIPNWDELTPVLIGCKIKTVTLNQASCVLHLTKNDKIHTLEFLNNDVRLPLMGNGTPRKDAFETGSIADYLVLQHDQGVLWVR